MSNNPLVKYVEENALHFVASSRYGVQTPYVMGSSSSRWYLDWIDYPRNNDALLTCAGVRVYVLDTGIFPSHPEFAGRVEKPAGYPGLSSVTGDCWHPGTSDDIKFGANASHGTSVASIIGGQRFGVAPAATLVDLRTHDCVASSASTATLIGALDFVKNDTNRGTRSVVNISSSGQWYGIPGQNASALSDAITTIVNLNIPVVVAAGNGQTAGGDNAWWYTPANAPRAITVGGTAKNSDVKWSFSNYGNTTVFYAPAQFMEAASLKIPQIPAQQQPETFNPGDREYYRSELYNCPNPSRDNCTSGTSFSAAVMSGIVARYLERNPGSSRDSIVSALQAENAIFGSPRVYEPATGNYLPAVIYDDCQ